MSEQSNFRTIHQVGSYPAKNEGAAITEMIDTVGPYLRSLPDGETGERQGYVMHIVEALRHSQAFEVKQEGDWSTVAGRTILRVKDRLRAEDIPLPYAMYAHKNWNLFEDTARKYGRTEDLAYQVSIPSPTTMEFIAIGPAGQPDLKTLFKPQTVQDARALLRHYNAFAEATAREITNIANWQPHRTICQIEATAELILTTKTPEPLRPLVANIMGQRIARLAMAVPEDAQLGLHLCLGSLDNRAEAAMDTLDPVVKLARAVLRAWPKDRQPLKYVHAPIATSNGPAPQNERFYQPLQNLHLPDETQFYAGIVQETQPLNQQKRALWLVENKLNRQVGVAAACGLGRRQLLAARAALARSVELATA
ncbi:MAG: hypothetical protein ACREGJ_01455 [Candidatus Saccharimonadales bacterium]